MAQLHKRTKPLIETITWEWAEKVGEEIKSKYNSK